MGSTIIVLIVGVIFLVLGLYSLIKGELPVLGFPEFFEGGKGKAISIVLILVGVIFTAGAFLAPQALMRLIDSVFRGCSRED